MIFTNHNSDNFAGDKKVGKSILAFMEDGLADFLVKLIPMSRFLRWRD